jgi:hypothetical protein
MDFHYILRMMKSARHGHLTQGGLFGQRRKAAGGDEGDASVPTKDTATDRREYFQQESWGTRATLP